MSQLLSVLTVRPLQLEILVRRQLTRQLVIIVLNIALQSYGRLSQHILNITIIFIRHKLQILINIRVKDVRKHGRVRNFSSEA